MSDRTVRWGGVAAIVFVVLILITVFSAGQPPMADDPIDKVRTYFVDHRSAILLNNLIGLVATALALWFAVVFREVVRDGDRTTNALGTASLAGLIVTAPLAMVGGALTAAPVYVEGVAEKLSDDVLRIVFEMQTLVFATTSGGLILFGLAGALAARRSGALPAYVTWVGLLMVLGNLLAAISVIGSGLAVLGLPGVLTFALFMLVTGVTMAAGKTGTAASAAR